MSRPIFETEHNIFREAFRAFVQREILPYHAQWEQDGIVSREVWQKAGRQGFLSLSVPETYGGPGVTDYRYNAIIGEEMAHASVTDVGFRVHTDVITPYILHYGTEAQKQRWLPGLASGDCIAAIALTEPGAGSDLGGIRTTARRQGDYYLLNGQKTFITNGILNDLVIVAAKTDPSLRHKGISLLVVERAMPGYERGRKLAKMGMHAQDTAELFFHDVRVPVENRLGEEGRGFAYLMEQLPRERLAIANSAITAAEAAFEWTLGYCKEREAFGQPIGSFQNSRFALAEMKTEIEIGLVFVDQCILDLNAGALTTARAAMAKWWTTELLKRVVDRCVQLHGGYGYMLEYPIAKAYLNARVQTIYGGATEIMKEIIGKSLGV